MSDIYCIACGEPWDAYGARHGDMYPWEYKLFRKGAGCPCCKGVSNDFTPSRMKHVEFGDEDPMIRINAFYDKEEGKLPEWKRPDNKVFWTCSGCGVQVVGNVDYSEDSDDYLEYHLPRDAQGNKWYNSHSYHRGCPEKEPAHTFGKGDNTQPVCEFCLSHCENCGAPVSSLIETSDVYDEGWCSTTEAYGYTDVFCVECIESMCSECNSLPEDCECIHCEKCGEHLATCNFDMPDKCPGCGMLTDKDE